MGWFCLNIILFFGIFGIINRLIDLCTIHRQIRDILIEIEEEEEKS